MVTTHGACSGGKLCDRDNKSWAASVSSILRSLNIELSTLPFPKPPVAPLLPSLCPAAVIRDEEEYLFSIAGLNLIISRFISPSPLLLLLLSSSLRPPWLWRWLYTALLLYGEMLSSCNCCCCSFWWVQGGDTEGDTGGDLDVPRRDGRG